MADLTASRVLEFVGVQKQMSPKVAASVTYVQGGVLVLKPTTGYAAKPSDTANEEIAGIVTSFWEDGDRADIKVIGTTSQRCVLTKGQVWLPFSGAAITDVGVMFYVSDDQTMTKTAGSKTVAYRALDFKAGVLLFDLNCPDRIA